MTNPFMAVDPDEADKPAQESKPAEPKPGPAPQRESERDEAPAAEQFDGQSKPVVPTALVPPKPKAPAKRKPKEA